MQGATRIVERGRDEAGDGGTRRITVHISFVTLYISLVFHLSFFVIQLLAVNERRLRLDGSGIEAAKVLLCILLS